MFGHAHRAGEPGTYKEMIEIKLDGLKVAIKEDTDGYVASVEFTKVDSRQLVGDSEVELLNDVIEIIQQHYESTADQIRLIQKLRMQKG